MDLDDAYVNAAYIPNAEQFPERWATEAQRFREIENAVGRAILNQPYGVGERQKYDLFLPSGRPEGLAIFVHGGYWRAFDRRDWSHFAAGCQARGMAVAMPSYDLAPNVRISEITRQITVAIDTIAKRISGPIYLVGHSAGGHLVSRMMCADIRLEAQDRIVRVLPVSPVSDLRPLMKTQMNEDFHLDEAEAIAESPALLSKAKAVPVHVWVGQDERPAFIDQAGWLATAWKADLTVEKGRHHFDVIDGLLTSDSDLLQTLFAPTS